MGNTNFFNTNSTALARVSHGSFAREFMNAILTKRTDLLNYIPGAVSDADNLNATAARGSVSTRHGPEH
jgi:hypothetical protein